MVLSPAFFFGRQASSDHCSTLLKKQLLLSGDSPQDLFKHRRMIVPSSICVYSIPTFRSHSVQNRSSICE